MDDYPKELLKKIQEDDNELKELVLGEARVSKDLRDNPGSSFGLMPWPPYFNEAVDKLLEERGIVRYEMTEDGELIYKENYNGKRI